MASFFIDKLVDILINLTPKIKERFTWQGKYIKKAISETIRKEYLDDKKIFIPPAINKNPIPLDHPEKEDTSSRKSLIDYFINKVFIDKTDEPHVICLLGDTGSGKSAALAHLLYDYIHHYPAKSQLPFTHIKLISLRTLREDKDFNRINNMSDKDQTILLLDALDECPMAQDKDGYKSLLKNLKDAYSDFARVVITCRPQFFPDNTQQSALIPKDIENDTSFLQCENRYLSPFNDTQIDEFLSRKFSSRHESPEYKEAWKIIKENRLLFIRPLVLTYIDILIQSKEPIKTTLDVHDCIIHHLLQDDIKKTKSPDNVEQRVRNWWNLSANVASYMYGQGKRTITGKEFEQLLSEPENKQLLSPDSAKSFMRRSLLTRTGNEYQFSHTSFYEYFLAYRFLQHPEEIKSVLGLNFALEILDQLYEAFTEKQQSLFSHLNTAIHEENFAFAFGTISNELGEINQFSEAIPRCRKALAIFDRLSQNNPNLFLYHKASALDNLSTLYCKINNHTEAESGYNKALYIRKKLAKSNPNFLPDVAATLNNLAALHSELHCFTSAINELNEALNIYRYLCQTNPNDFLPYVATVLHNKATLYADNNYHIIAINSYQEALKIRRYLANTDKEYLSYVALTLNNMATTHLSCNDYINAEKEHQEALAIRRQLAADNPQKYLPDLAMTLGNLAILHCNTNNHAAAEKENAETLNIYRQLAKTNPYTFLPDVAHTLFNMALLHCDKGELDKAEAAAKESLEIYRTMAEKSPAAFVTKIKMVEKLLAEIQEAAQQHRSD